MSFKRSLFALLFSVSRQVQKQTVRGEIRANLEHDFNSLEHDVYDNIYTIYTLQVTANIISN